MEKLAELLTTMTSSLVDHPESIQVALRPSAEAEPMTFLVYVAPGEIGQAIGKEGRLANAVRLIVKANARRMNLGRVLVEFLEHPVPKDRPNNARERTE